MDCRVCSKPFEPARPLQSVCSMRCAVRQVKAQKTDLKRQTKARKEAVKPRSKWLQEAQQAFNAWIRARDACKGCISCGTHVGKANAGHYLSTAARPELRFDELNVHLQCERCNTYLHGNLIAYRQALIERIGLSAVESLEGPHPAQKWTVYELKAIKDEYRARLKEIV
jgi:uncharacterized protein YecT (DUF1311 family)